MNDISECKSILFEVVFGLKTKATYLKSIDASDPNFNELYYDGMALAYHMVMDEIMNIVNRHNLDLEELDLKDYNPNEILFYKPLNYRSAR